MCNENEWIVREAFLAYDRGDFARMMDFVDPGLQWTYLDPGLAEAASQVCSGRAELERVLRLQADLGLHSSGTRIERGLRTNDLNKPAD